MTARRCVEVFRRSIGILEVNPKMKKKRPQQQVTPATKGLNILAIKRSPEQ
jgi:hypothetical protein